MFVKLLFSILIFFVPLSFAATEPWAFFIFQFITSFIFVYLLFKEKKFKFTLPAVLINIVFIFLIFVAVIQIMNHHTIIQKGNILPFTVSPFNTLKELNAIFVYFMFFIVVNQIFYKSDKIKKLLYLITFSSAFVMFIGLCFPSGEYIKFFLGTESLGNFGPFTNRNNAGIFLSMSFFITLSLVIYNFYKYPKYLMKNQKGKYITVQTVNITISLMFFISVILSRSRGAMLSTAVSLIIFLFLCTYHFSETIKQKLFKLFILFLIMLPIGFFIYKNINDINVYSQRTTGKSEQIRLKLYKMSFNVLEDYPFTGIGFASFPIITDKYLEEDLNAYPEYLHSDWLELLLDVGYPIYTIFLFLVSAIILLLIKRIKFLSNQKKFLFIGLFSACCSVCTGSFVDFHLHIPAIAMIFVICLALLSSLSFYKDKKSIDYKNNLSSNLVLCSVILFLLFFSFKTVMAWKYYTFSKNMSKEQEIEYLNKAVKLSNNPRYIENYIITIYNDSLEKEEYDENLRLLVYRYIKQYPYNEKISKIFIKIND